MLDECRQIDPSLPTWNYLFNSQFNNTNEDNDSHKSYFVDKFGFKYDRNNETMLCQFLCQQLITFYEDDANNNHSSSSNLNRNNLNFLYNSGQENSFWRSVIKQWNSKLNLTINVKSSSHLKYYS
jgi:hypothetical protein